MMQIQPLEPQIPNPDNFPLWALGPRLIGAVQEGAQLVRSSVAPVAVSLLSAVSLTCQGLIQVEKKPGLTSPVSLFFLSIQPSGERKTAISNIIFNAIRNFISEKEVDYQQKRAEYKAKMSAWSAEKKGIENSIRKKSENGESIEVDIQRLNLNARAEPTVPRHFKLIHENTTPRALVGSLINAFPTTSLISDEALVVLNARGLSDPGLLNKMWDGSRLTMDRIESGETIIDSPTLTLALFLQDGIFNKLMAEKGEILRDSGLLARCFVVAPAPMAGYRFLAYDSTPIKLQLEYFEKRCTELLNRYARNTNAQAGKKNTVSFSPEAQSRWMQEHDYIESIMQPGNMLYNLRDFGSKHADKIARLSALLHYFDGHEGPIPLASLERAIAIANWFRDQHLQIFNPPPQPTQEEIDAFTLEEWLLHKYRATGYYYFQKNIIRQYGPNPLRSKNRLNSAIDLLMHRGVIALGIDQQSRKQYISLTQQSIPQVFPYQ